MPRILKRPRVVIDLVDAATFIARDNPDAAARLLDAAEDAFKKLADMPRMGPLYGFRAKRLADIRFWPIKGFRNYLVFYRPIEDGIEVIRILHGAQNVKRIIRRT